MILIGDKQTFAFETSRRDKYLTHQVLTVDIYIAGKRLTVQDNAVYVPQFLGDIDAAQRHMRNDLGWLQYRDDLSDMNLTEGHLHLAKTQPSFLNWGPTTDDISCQLIAFRNSLWITVFLYSEYPDHESIAPFVEGARISPFDLILTLQQQADLMSGYHQTGNA